MPKDKQRIDRNVRVRTHRAKREEAAEPDAAGTREPAGRDNVTDIRKARRGRRLRTWRGTLIRLGVLAAALAVVVAVWANWDALGPSGMWDNVRNLFTGQGGGDGFPVPISGDTVVEMMPAESHLAVLTDTALLLFNGKGGEVQRRAHTYSHPAMRAAGGYLLTADLGGRQFRLDTAREAAWSREAPGGIVALDVTAGGMAAVVTESSRSYVSEAVVLDRQGAEVFHWYSAEWLVTGAALRGDGKQMAVVGVTAEGGAMKAALMVFDLADSSGEPVAMFTDTELMLMEVRYTQDGGLTAVGDRACWSVPAGLQTRTAVAYADVELVGYAAGGSGTALAVRHYGSGGGGEVRLLDGAGTVTQTAAFTGRFHDLTAAGDGFWLLAGGELLRLEPGAAGGVASRTAVAVDSMRVAALPKQVLVLGLTEIRAVGG